MSLSIGKSVVFHPHRTSSEALGARIRVTTKVYSPTGNSAQRIWKHHVVEATLRDISPAQPASSAGALMFMSSRDRYIFELNTTADYDEVTKELLSQYAEKMKQQLAEYEASEKNAAILSRVRQYAATAPTLHIEASSSKYVIAESDTLLIHVLNHQMMFEPLGHITDIEIFD
jgi:hypothetical protein